MPAFINWEGIARFLSVPVEEVRALKLKAPTDAEISAALEAGSRERLAGAIRARMKR